MLKAIALLQGNFKRHNDFLHRFRENRFLNSHSQTTMTFQPSFCNFKTSRSSRSTFPAIFFFQKSELFCGHTKYLHPSCPCQKQPFTKITVLYFGSTTSGFPGSFASFFRYQKPCENRYFLTISSGLVFLLRMGDIL